MAEAAQFHWEDPLLLDQQLTEDERMVRDAAAAYSQDKLQPTLRSSAKWASSGCSGRRFRSNTAAPA
jgi:hypothetical protein